MDGWPQLEGSPPARWWRSCSIFASCSSATWLVFVSMRPRQALAIVLRLNRVLDKGIAVAVVGYTDALVATLFAQNGVPGPSSDDAGEIDRQLRALETELAGLVQERKR